MNDMIFAALKFGVGGLGIIFLAVGIGLRVVRKRMQSSCTQAVSARVVDLMEAQSRDMDGDVSVTWFPVYEYYFNGQKYTRRSNVGGTRRSMFVGQNVELFVNPENPEEFYYEKDALKTVAAIFIVVGIILMAAAVIMAVVQQRWNL